MCGGPGTIVGMATLTVGNREGGNSLHVRVPAGYRITMFANGAAGFLWRGAGGRVTRRRCRAAFRPPWSSLPGCHAGIRTGILRRTPARTPTLQPERPLHALPEELRHEVGEVVPPV